MHHRLQSSHFRPEKDTRTTSSRCGRLIRKGKTALTFAALFLALNAFFGCSHPQPTLVVVVGGLGFSQLNDIKKAVDHQCPRADVVSAGGWDGYKSDLKKIVHDAPHRHIVFVGHSFGCGAVADAAAHLPKVDLAIFIDPAWNDFKLPKTIGHYLWYKRSDLGIEREARILGAATPRTIQGSHNSIPHSAVLIASVVDAINRIKDPKTAPVKTLPQRKVASR